MCMSKQMWNIYYKYIGVVSCKCLFGGKNIVGNIFKGILSE